MRVFVLALDGLEYSLVVKWRLLNLMQRRYGYFEIPREYFHKGPRRTTPYTPKIWASFITGKKPCEHGVDSLWTYGSFLDRIRRLPVISWVRGKRRILWKLRLKPRVVDRRDLSSPTIFDVVKPSIAVNVMSYNTKLEYRRRVAEAFYRGREYEREIWRVFEDEKRDVLEALEKAAEWRLFMAYFDLADWAGHLYRARHPLKLMRAYLELDKLAGELKRRVEDGNTIFLIVSDHGMEPSEDGATGVHSTRAYWSLNIDEDWEPEDFTDFYYKILEWCRN